MRKYLSLTKVLLKGGMGMTDGSSKKWFKYFLYGILAISFLPMLGILYFMIDAMLPAYAMLDQTASILGSMMFLACILIFVFSIFLIPSVFYFSSDTDLLLALPLKPEQIIGSKFTTCLIYEYLFSIGVLLPTYAAYLHFGGFSISLILYGLLVILLMPIYPLVLSTILTILLMRFVPFFKNRDRFNMISGILLLVVVFAFTFSTNSVSSMDSETAMLEMMLSGNNSMLELFMKLFPMIPFFARAVVEGATLDFIIGAAICLVSLFVLLTLGKFLYFKGAIGNGESSSSHKALNDAQFHKATRQGNKILTYAKKDLKLLIRTPAYFMNCISSAIAFPLVLIFMPMFTSTSAGGFDLKQLIPLIEGMDDFMAYVIMAGLGAGLMLGMFNMISATAISREGTNVTMMKYLPMSYRDQIHAKTLCGILLGWITVLFTVLPMAFYFPLSWYYYVIFFLCACVTTVLGNELCVMVDLLKPKLIWEQEAAAVKQNLGAFVSMMGGMALCVLFIAVCFIIPEGVLMITAIITAILCLLGAIGAYMLAGVYAEKAMLKL